MDSDVQDLRVRLISDIISSVINDSVYDMPPVLREKLQKKLKSDLDFEAWASEINYKDGLTYGAVVFPNEEAFSSVHFSVESSSEPPE